jgi:hypothetical protein
MNDTSHPSSHVYVHNTDEGGYLVTLEEPRRRVECGTYEEALSTARRIAGEFGIFVFDATDDFVDDEDLPEPDEAQEWASFDPDC